MVRREVEKKYDVDKRTCQDEPGPTSGWVMGGETEQADLLDVRLQRV
jgi:hypothetical protein